MRKLLLLPVAGLLVLAFVNAAIANDEAKAIVEKAVKAHGGKEALTKFEKKAALTRSKGTLHQFGGVELTTESKMQDPDKLRVVTETVIMGAKVKQIQVFNGDNVWMNVNVNGQDMSPELTDDMKKEIREQLHQEKMAGLVFLQDKSIEMTTLGEAAVAGKPALGIRVSSKGHRDISLYFDKDSGLLVKVEARIIDFMSQQEQTQERIMSEYKEVDGVKRPTKVSIKKDGKDFLDLEVLEVKIVDKFDDSEFEKP